MGDFVNDFYTTVAPLTCVLNHIVPFKVNIYCIEMFKKNSFVVICNGCYTNFLSVSLYLDCFQENLNLCFFKFTENFPKY